MRLLHPAAADHSVSIRGSRCTALIHPFALEPSGGVSLRSCVIDSAISNMAESLCLCRDPAFVPAPGAALCPVESEVI